jgi:hypothetical protein
MLDTWYFSYGQEKIIDELIENIEKKHVASIEVLNEMVSEIVEVVILTDKQILSEIQSRLLLQAYVAKLAGFSITSSCAYSLCFQNSYRKILIESIVDKSIMSYLSSVVVNNENKNKCAFGSKNKSSYTSQEAKKLISEIEDKWK